MNSLVAEVITLLKTRISGLGGISPAPVPVNAQFPYITVSEIGTQDAESLQGRSNLHRTIIQVDCWDKVHETAWNVRKIVDDLLNSYRGVTGSYLIQWINPNTGASFYDGNRSLHQSVTRVFVWWSVND
jgi:hypothetical protein